MSTSHAINEADELPSGVLDLGEHPAILRDLAYRGRQRLLGGFWEITVILDATDAEHTGVGFLSGIETDRVVPVFFFVRFPRRENTELLTVKSLANVYKMREAPILMSDQEDIEFKINVMLTPSACSPELLPRLFANIRELSMRGVRAVDWNQMASALPRHPAPDTNWHRVLGFVGEMGQS